MNVAVLEDRYLSVGSVIADLYDVTVRVGVSDPRDKHPQVLPEEVSAILRATEKRRQEFAAGRAAGRTALAGLGYAAQAIPKAADGSPVWPAGVGGSISHTDRLCVAVVTKEPHHLGLDIEEDTSLPCDLVKEICSPAELNRISGPREPALAKVIFSAKEAAYKAQFPRSGQLIGFDHMDVTLLEDEGKFVATILRHLSGFEIGETIDGRFAFVAGHVITSAQLSV